MVMKRKILILVMCLACVAAYGQRKPRKPKPKPKPVTTQATTTTSAAPPVDTTKKLAAKPLKPFDRPLDGYYKKSNILNAKVTPYPTLRESDVAYAKRVWREIDLREKMNQYLASPKQ